MNSYLVHSPGYWTSLCRAYSPTLEARVWHDGEHRAWSWEVKDTVMALEQLRSWNHANYAASTARWV